MFNKIGLVFWNMLLTTFGLIMLIQSCTRLCDSQCYMKRGIQAYRQGDLTQAQQDFQNVIKISPNLPEAHNNLGVVLYKKNELDPAITAFRKSLELAPNYGEAQANLGFGLEKKGDLSAATAEFTEKLPATPNPERSNLSLELGLPEGHGVLSEKITSYRNEVKNRPYSWEAHYNLGVALDQQGDLVNAIASYRETIRLNPNFAEAYGNLGNALVLAGYKEEGLGYMRVCRDLFEQQKRSYDVRKAEELIKQLQNK
jgi:Flp pilus assembly protein TadD